MKPRKYPEGMRDFVKSIAFGITTRELTAAVNQKYGPGTITEEKMRAYKKNNGIVSGLDCRFKKGREPANKGKKMPPEQYEKCKSTMFKKGNIPANSLEIGAYTHTTGGFIIQKVQENGTQQERYVYVHRAVWEKHNGPIPKGKVVGFLDGNKDNCSIENLFLVDCEINLILNRNGLRFNDAKLTETGINIAKLKAQISRQRRRKNKKNE